MKLLVFLALMVLVSATIDRKPYYRKLSPENDERQETMKLIAEKRDRASKIDWNNFNPSAVKNRGPARGARISAFMNKMDANKIPPSDTIAPYETKSENDIDSPKKSVGYGYASNYHSAMKTIAPGAKINIAPNVDTTYSTSKYQEDYSGYDPYKKSSKYPSVNDKESSAESLTSKYQGSSFGYRPYASDSENISPVIRPPVPMSRISVGSEEPSIKSPTTKYKAKISGYGSYKDDSDNDSHIVRPPTFMSKINSMTGESSVKSATSKYQTKNSSRGSYEKDSDNESHVVRPPTFMSKINSMTGESSVKSATSKYQTKNSSHGSHQNESEYVSPVVKLSTAESKMHVSTPPALTKSPKPTYQMESSANIHVNNAERLTPLSETDRGKFDETVAPTASKFQAARSFWSGTPSKSIEVMIPNVKLPNSAPKIPVPLVPIRNNGTMTSIRSFVADSPLTPNAGVSSPLATEKSSSPPSNSMNAAKLMSNARNTPMNVAQQMRSNSKTSDKSFVGSAGAAPKKGGQGSNESTVHDKMGIYERVKAATFKPSFYTFPKIPNKYAGY